VITVNEYNCDSLKNLPVPEKLIEKAMAIPETAAKLPAALPWYRNNRLLATAASIMLAVTVGISVFLFFGSQKPPIEPVADPTETAFASSVPSESPSGEPDSVPPTEPVTSGVTEKATSAPTNGAADSTTPPSSTASEPSPTSSASEHPQAPATVVATQPASQKPSVQRETERPTTTPSATVPQKPTQIEPADETKAPEPWEYLPTDMPTEPPINTPTDASLTLRVNFGASNSLYHGTVYCRIYDRDKKIVLGDPDRFADSHKAHVNVVDGIVYASYCPEDHGITLAAGNYSIAFHNEEGKTFQYYYYTVKEESP
jgi:hypothetical protein